MLEELHNRNFVHGDIQPDNIVIGQDNSVLLINFGRSFKYVEDQGQHKSNIIDKYDYCIMYKNRNDSEPNCPFMCA